MLTNMCFQSSMLNFFMILADVIWRACASNLVCWIYMILKDVTCEGQSPYAMSHLFVWGIPRDDFKCHGHFLFNYFKPAIMLVNFASWNSTSTFPLITNLLHSHSLLLLIFCMMTTYAVPHASYKSNNKTPHSQSCSDTEQHEQQKISRLWNLVMIAS
jgi:hypothetical protein